MIIEVGNKKVNDQIIFIISKQFNINEEWICTVKGEMFIDIIPDIKKK